MTYDEVRKICLRYGIETWSLNSQTGMVDVYGRVDLWNKNLTELPLNFGNVKGDFMCRANELTTLKGAPHFVGGVFGCSSINIKARHKLPNVVYGIYCNKNMKWIF